MAGLVPAIHVFYARLERSGLRHEACGSSPRAALLASAHSLLQTSLAGLVVFAERLNPIPSRTRPLNSPAPMVLSLKAWKSRSLPGLPRTLLLLNTMIDFQMAARDGGHFYLKRRRAHFARVFLVSVSLNCAPTRELRCGGGTPSVFRRTSGRQAEPPTLNALHGVHRSATSVANATVRVADAVR